MAVVMGVGSGCAVSREREVAIAREIATAYFDARCARAVRCGGEGRTSDFGRRTCHEATRRAQVDAVASAVESGALRVVAELAPSCLAGFDEWPCRIVPEVPRVTSTAGAACAGLFEGPRGEGETCELVLAFFDDCAGGLSCQPAAMCGGEPRCVSRPRVGEQCFGGCDVGLVCDYEEDGSGVCRTERWRGEACTEDDACVSFDGVVLECIGGVCDVMPGQPLGASCDSERPCDAEGYCDWFTCVPKRQRGQSCDSVRCESGLRCIVGPSSSVCGDLGGAGEECVRDDECAPEAPYCVITPSSSTRGACAASPIGAPCEPTFFLSPYLVTCPMGHRCEPPGRCALEVAAGEECDGVDHVCALGTQCTEGRCIRVALPDEPCGDDAVCPAVHRCLGGVCTPWPVLGEPCDDACFVGMCRDGICVLGRTGDACDPLSSERQCEWVCSVGTCVARPTCE